MFGLSDKWYIFVIHRPGLGEFISFRLTVTCEYWENNYFVHMLMKKDQKHLIFKARGPYINNDSSAFYMCSGEKNWTFRDDIYDKIVGHTVNIVRVHFTVRILAN